MNKTKDFPQWVVVENAGMENESIGNEFTTFKEACENVEDWYGSSEDEGDGMYVRIMRRQEDGTLTSEY
ncbi:MAG: hypothetical protein RLZZ298_3028 [Pseudomonadota bacterium]|jgi:hypothetical protein